MQVTVLARAVVVVVWKAPTLAQCHIRSVARPRGVRVMVFYAHNAQLGQEDLTEAMSAGSQRKRTKLTSDKEDIVQKITLLCYEDDRVNIEKAKELACHAMSFFDCDYQGHI